MIFNEISDNLLRINNIHAVCLGNLAHLYIILWKIDRINFNLSVRKKMLQFSFISYLHSYHTLVLSCHKDIYLLIPSSYNVYNKVLTILLLEKLFTLNEFKFFAVPSTLNTLYNFRTTGPTTSLEDLDLTSREGPATLTSPAKCLMPLLQATKSTILQRVL